MSSPPDNITVVPNENNLASWEVTIDGPVRHLYQHLIPCASGLMGHFELMIQPSPSPYTGGKFKLGVEFGLDYPFKAPQVSNQDLGIWRY